MKKLTILLLMFSLYGKAQVTPTIKLVYPLSIDTSNLSVPFPVFIDPTYLSTLATVSSVTAVNAKLTALIAKDKVDSANFEAKLASAITRGISPTNYQTASYTVRLSDAGRPIVMDCSGCTLTIPYLQDGFNCTVRTTGTVTISVPTGSVKIKNFNSNSTSISGYGKPLTIMNTSPNLVNLR